MNVSDDSDVFFDALSDFDVDEYDEWVGSTNMSVEMSNHECMSQEGKDSSEDDHKLAMQQSEKITRNDSTGMVDLIGVAKRIGVWLNTGQVSSVGTFVVVTHIFVHACSGECCEHDLEHYL